MRKKLSLVPALAALAAVLVFPPTGVAAHEGTCANAIASGNYNVIVATTPGTITGTDGDDVIIGSSGADTINAGNGNDVVCGRGGADTIDGGNGNDLLLGDVCTGCPGGDGGTAGNDTIAGGNGDDTLWGDEGDDRLFGENGDDRLIGGNPGGDGDETDACDGGRGTTTVIRCP